MSKRQGGMGFRNLYGFNLALIGKQVWHLATNPDSLVTRLYKARYFADRHIFQATKPRGCSYIWEGIWEAKERLKNGFRWVLGDGQSIDICKDPWLRAKTNHRVEEKDYPVEVARGKVKDLFMQGRKMWDADKINNCFDQCDASAIFTTRIPQNSTSDRLAWDHSADGQYSVKTGYRYWHEHNIGVFDVPQSLGWSRIWKLHIPHKVKVFLWRLCRNTIPMNYRIRNKGVMVPITCSMCAGDIEHLRHIFFECEFAMTCWQDSGLNLNMADVEVVPDWILAKLVGENNESLVTMATVLWSIWNARNKRVWENVSLSPAAAVSLSSSHIHDWQQASKNKSRTGNVSRSAPSCDGTKWQVPEVGSLKINVDASVKENEDFFSLGMVIRDDQGRFIMGKTHRIVGRISVLEAEAIGVMEALLWTSDFPDKPIAVETDSLLTVNAIKHKTTSRLEIGHVIQQCRDYLATGTSISLGFVKKLANNVAHKLARLPCELNSFVTHMSPPQILLETIMYDVS